ncbi:MAG TPA: hypothetical protein VKT78_01015 [Fimbriimonadaceae bacterium]|nr:hypothetical protein [Fimbriimonadaceae bacterium]
MSKSDGDVEASSYRGLRRALARGETAQIAEPIESTHWFVGYPESLLEPGEGETAAQKLEKMEKLAARVLEWNKKL